MINLDDHDRMKFIAHCRGQADSYQKIIEQMEKANMPEEVIKRNRAKASAFMIVSMELDVESVTVSADNVGEI